MKPIVVSGLKPSGELHIGNYLGMLKNAVALQDSGKYRCFYFIADYHALSQRYNPKEKAKEIFMMAMDLIAAGIDPDRSAIFIQSHISEHANLAWIFNSIASVSRLEAMIEYREKLEEGQPANAALFNYPILMAADILIYKAALVPVGDDQRQHLEVARDTARAFNSRFGKTFKEPKAILTKVPRLMSIDNPEKKMSKSLPRGCVFLSDSPKIIKDKLKRAVTDSGREIIYDPEKKAGISNLILIYGEFAGKPTSEVVKKFRGANYSEFKAEVAEIIIKTLAGFNEKRAELLKSPEVVAKILAEGAQIARPIAQATLLDVKKKIGLI